MKFMTIAQIVLMILMLLFIGHFSINIYPFEIAFPYWHRALGVLLMIVGIMVYDIGEHHKGYVDGQKSTINIVEQFMKNKNNVNTEEK